MTAVVSTDFPRLSALADSLVKRKEITFLATDQANGLTSSITGIVDKLTRGEGLKVVTVTVGDQTKFVEVQRSPLANIGDTIVTAGPLTIEMLVSSIAYGAKVAGQMLVAEKQVLVAGEVLVIENRPNVYGVIIKTALGLIEGQIAKVA